MGKTAKELAKELMLDVPHIAAAEGGEEERKAAFAFAEGYKDFLGRAKTEREFSLEAKLLLEKAGYVPFVRGTKYTPGSKVYYLNRGKSLVMTTFGKKPLSCGLRMNAAHIDSPRLDLKPRPLYEKEDIAFFKTHYYGGIRKYQWVTMPLAMHGVIIKKDGETVSFAIGEEQGDPGFTISDLLPHLSSKQDTRSLKDGIRGEELNIIVGSLPFAAEEEEKVKEPVKLMALSLLHERYGITEKDFLRAEVEFVPAVKPADVGFDRGLIGAYGQDDKVCAYPALMAQLAAHTEVRCGVRVTAITPDGVEYETAAGERAFLAADTVLCAAGLRPLTEVVDALRGTAPIVEVIGDCVKPDIIRGATWRAYHAALDL